MRYKKPKRFNYNRSDDWTDYVYIRNRIDTFFYLYLSCVAGRTCGFTGQCTDLHPTDRGEYTDALWKHQGKCITDKECHSPDTNTFSIN